MAYAYQQGVAKNGDDLMVKIKDFLITTLGWTSIQNTVTTGVSGQAVACSSSGEDGLSKNVIRVVRNATNIACYGFNSWSAGTTLGRNGIGGTAGVFNADANNLIVYWLFGSLDRLIVFVTSAGVPALGGIYLGKYTPARSPLFAVTVNAEAAGSAVVVEVDRTDLFTVGRRYTLIDDNGYEFPKVTAINPGVSVTLDVLQNSYLAGARFGEDPRPLVVAGSAGVPLGINQVNFTQVLASPWTGGPAVAAAAPATPQVAAAGQAAIRPPVDFNAIERGGGPEAVFDGGANIFDLWPLFVCGDGFMLNAGHYGSLIGVYATSRTGIATDDTIVVGGETYHYLNTSPGNATGVFGICVRRA